MRCFSRRRITIRQVLAVRMMNETLGVASVDDHECPVQNLSSETNGAAASVAHTRASFGVVETPPLLFFFRLDIFLPTTLWNCGIFNLGFQEERLLERHFIFLSPNNCGKRYLRNSNPSRIHRTEVTTLPLRKLRRTS